MDSHWVNGPKDQCEAGDGAEEGGCLGILVLNNAAAIDCELVDDYQVGNASHGVPSPLRTLLDGEGGEETGQDHDDIGNNSNENVGTSQTSEQGKIEEEEWGSDTPVDVTSPVNLTVNGLGDIRNVASRAVYGGDLVVANAILDCHGEV